MVGVPTSFQSRLLCGKLGIPVRDMQDCASLDLAIDGADPAVIGSLFAGGEGVRQEVLRGRTSAFVVKVVQRMPADRDAFQSQKESLRKTLMQRRQNQVFTEWLTTLKKQAEVKDYRFGQIDG